MPENVYHYNADIYCEACGRAIRERLAAEGQAPARPDDEHSYDSGDYPKGPVDDGGGEADTPQNCAACHVHLGNPLTPAGVDYVLEYLREYVTGGGDPSGEVLDAWAADLGDYSEVRGDKAFVLAAFNALRAAERRDDDDPHKFTVVAVVAGRAIAHPHVEAKDADTAAIIAVAGAISGPGGITTETFKTAEKFWRHDGTTIDGTHVYAVIPGHARIVAGDCVVPAAAAGEVRP